MSVAGKWNVSMNTPIGKQDLVWQIREVDGGWTGTMDAKTGTSALTNVQVDGAQVSFASSVSSPMGTIQVTFNGAASADTISGTCKTMFGDFAFSGARA